MQLGNLMESEILSQPDLLASRSSGYLDQLSSMVGGQKYEMVLIAARGSSDNAALYARYLIEIHLRIPVVLAAPSTLTRYKSDIKYPKCLAIGISQSGAAPDVAEVLARMKAQGHSTLAITNTAGSRMHEEAEHCLLLEAGTEQAVAATKTYSSSLLAMYQLVRALGADLPAPNLPSSSWANLTREAAQEALGPVLRSTILFSLARGYNFSTAQETALKLMECALLPCKSYSTADFQHGPKALAGHGTCALVFGPRPEDIEAQGCLVVSAPEYSDAADSPIAEIFFGQWIALLAARARGLNPDDPRFLSKVTMTL
ncbi:MAG: SIS domain-containing protein [Armatimonadetes bacterium]|nr:SIS domain-containing protein [Armatimonadota bacterium]